MSQPDAPPEAGSREALSPAASLGNTAVGRLLDRTARGGGAAMPPSVRTDMESAFGADLSAVRLHGGPAAARLNEAVGAQAFTAGADIFLSRGLEPSAGPGREVLAHELTHVMQNAAASGPPPAAVSRPGDPAEREAVRVAAAVVSGSAPNHTVAGMLGGTAPSAAVQRWSADEHLALGDTTGMTIDIGDGVVLTFGQVMALAGDEFGTLDELTKAMQTPDGRAMIRAHLERAKLPAPQGTGMLPAPTKDQAKQAGWDYAGLALENTAHFSAGGTAADAWAGHHAEAIGLALRAGLFGEADLMNSAKLTEAFGTHFLTDAFAAGHVRVPRQEMIDYYTNTVAPSVYDHLVAYVKRYVVEEVSEQVKLQTGKDDLVRGLYGPLQGPGRADAAVWGRVEPAVRAKLDTFVAEGGGRDKVVQKLGLVLAGVVAGALHEIDNREGLMVTSAAHPGPWQAFGDSSLHRDPTHRQRTEEALALSVADITAAYDIGVAERQAMYNVPEPSALPSVAHFELGEADATPATQAAAQVLAHHMRYRAGTVVTLTGHTCPIGTEGANQQLGMGRAITVESILTADGVDQSRVEVASQGEKSLVTDNPAEYGRNRRVEFVYSTDAALAATQEPAEQIALRRAMDVAASRIGPPYAAGEHIPRESPGVYADVQPWEWHEISGPLQAELGTYVVSMINDFKDEALKSKDLDAVEVEGFKIELRPIVSLLIARIQVDPVAFMRDAIGM